jgi:hypothetical protein
MKSGWVSLAGHLENRSGEGGHPELSQETLVEIRRGYRPSWMKG